jgi:ABC-type nitrate/sulfonate/bicarbonate transport system substrate-binding protein
VPDFFEAWNAAPTAMAGRGLTGSTTSIPDVPFSAADIDAAALAWLIAAGKSTAGSLRRGNPLVDLGVAGEGFEPP